MLGTSIYLLYVEQFILMTGTLLLTFEIVPILELGKETSRWKLNMEAICPG